MKSQSTGREEIFAKGTSDKKQVSTIGKQITRLNKNGPETSTGFTEEDTELATENMKR